MTCIEKSCQFQNHGGYLRQHLNNINLPRGTATYFVEHIVSGQSIHVVLLVSGSPSQRWDSGR